MPKKRGAKRPAPKLGRSRKIERRGLTPLEAKTLYASELLDKLLELAIADPDVEREFAKLVEIMFERTGVPPPPIDISDDINTVVDGIVKHLYNYKNVVYEKVNPRSEIEEEEYMKSVALDVLINAAELVIKWYAPRTEAYRLISWGATVEQEAQQGGRGARSSM